MGYKTCLAVVFLLLAAFVVSAGMYGFAVVFFGVFLIFLRKDRSWTVVYSAREWESEIGHQKYRNYSTGVYWAG